MAATATPPPQLARQDFYARTLPAVAQRFEGYDVDMGEMFLSLAMAYDTITSHFGRRLGRYGLTFPAFNVLMIVNSPSYRETGCPMSQIGELLLVSKANVTGLVDSLQRKSFVKRCDADYDRRVKLVRLTAKGATLLGRVLPGHLAEVSRILGTVSKQDRIKLRDLLRKLQAGLEHAMEADDAQTTR
jgi:MarR family 2-MHQ and catechol resistance regulon transcriptional repressor